MIAECLHMKYVCRFILSAPYEYNSKIANFATPRRITSVSWTPAGDAFIIDRWRKDRSTSMWLLRNGGRSVAVKIPQFDRKYEDLYSSPGMACMA